MRLEAAGTMVQFRTVKGDIVVELLDQDKPATVANFLRYVQNVYPTNNNFIHRLIPNFALQGGGYTVEDRHSKEDFFSFAPLDLYAPITNEFKVGKKMSNTFGTLAMARSPGETNSATSQWFFNLADNSADLDSADGGFTVFGKVVSGTNILQFFNTLSKQTSPAGCTFHGIVDMRCFYGDVAGVRPFQNVPVQYLETAYPRYVDFFYVDITLYNVRVKVLPNKSREIRWNTVKGKTNTVEFTTQFPPTWTKLRSLVGDGLEQATPDTEPHGQGRFYRVRVD